MAVPESLGSPAASDPGRQRSPEVTVSQQEVGGVFLIGLGVNESIGVGVLHTRFVKWVSV